MITQKSAKVKPMPRPVNFDRLNVLEQSMNLFWQNGYTNTSMQQLGEQMDMRPGSLYGAFRSKRQLFLAALDLYFERSSRLLAERLQLGDSPLGSIRNFFSLLIEDLADEHSIQGCLMINTATELAGQDEEIRLRLDTMFQSHEQQFFKVLQQAQKADELGSDKDPEALARFLLMGVRGIKVYSQTRTSRDRLENLVETLLTVVEDR